MEGARANKKYQTTIEKRKGGIKVAQELVEYSAMSPSVFVKELEKLEKKMHQHARDLEFEEAAQTRDKISLLKDRFMT